MQKSNANYFMRYKKFQKRDKERISCVRNIYKISPRESYYILFAFERNERRSSCKVIDKQNTSRGGSLHVCLHVCNFRPIR